MLMLIMTVLLLSQIAVIWSGRHSLFQSRLVFHEKLQTPAMLLVGIPKLAAPPL
jgi:hypothetical protein